MIDSDRDRCLLSNETRDILCAMRGAVRNAIIDHKLKGHSIPVLAAGNVVWIPAEAIQIPPEPLSGEDESQ